MYNLCILLMNPSSELNTRIQFLNIFYKMFSETQMQINTEENFNRHMFERLTSYACIRGNKC